MKLLNSRLLGVLAMAVFLISMTVLGQEPVPEVDPINTAVKLVTTWGSLGALAKGSLIVTIAVAAIRKWVNPSMVWKRLTVTALSAVYSVITAMGSGMGVVDALVLTLITGGGAIAIYEQVKGLKEVATAGRETNH